MHLVWTKRVLRLGCPLVLGTAMAVMLPMASLGAQNGAEGAGDDCRTWEALQGKCAKANPNTDDVLDYPNLYTGRVLTLEGRIDDIHSPTTFAMEDNYDLIGADRILMISVMPQGARTAGKTTSTVRDDRAPVPAVEMVQLLQDEFTQDKIIRATGLVRMFDRAAIEREYGPIDVGSAPLNECENKPVVLLGAREFAQFMERQRVEQQAAVIPPPAPPAPPPPPQAQPAPHAEATPERHPPATQPQLTPAGPEAEAERPTTLPKTASPLPLLGMAGLLALLLAFGFRSVRRRSE